MDKIIIKGAREHNLKNIDVELPRDKLIVITGLSGRASPRWPSTRSTRRGSGARRVAVDLCAAVPGADGQARPRLHRGLSPAISIEQKSTSKNPRSTVGTVTEITTTCGCSTPASAPCTATAAAWRSRRRRCSRWSTACSSCRKGRASRCWRQLSATARASIKELNALRRQACAASASTATCTICPKTTISSTEQEPPSRST